MKPFISLSLIVLFSACTPRPVDPTVSDAKVADRPLSFMEKMEQEALQTPFSGVVTSSGAEADLFPVHATNVSTEPIVTAAQDFLQSLTTEQKEITQYAVDHEEWRRWSNVDNGIYPRNGISLKEMTAAQRAAAEALLKVSLSAKGLQLSKDIMKTDQTLRELNDNDPAFDEELYYFTILGTPSTIEPWGWQIDGHHLIINYFVLGDQVVMTPTFMGGEPIITTSGKYAGNTIFQDEQNIGLRFMQSLPTDLQTKATLSETKSRHDAKTEAFKDNVVLDYAGLRASDMSPEQQEALLELADQYISNMRDGHAKVKLEDIRQHMANTWFAWSGSTEEDAVFYYRIHSPVVLIEFDHQSPVGAPGKRGEASRNHIHTVVRTPNGNDYGKDLLRQHLQTHSH